MPAFQSREVVQPVAMLRLLLEEARAFYRSLDLGRSRWIPDGSGLLMPLRCSDWSLDALALLLTARGVEASNGGVALRVENRDVQRVELALR